MHFSNHKLYKRIHYPHHTQTTPRVQLFVHQYLRPCGTLAVRLDRIQRMIALDPPLNKFLEILSLLNEQVCICFSRDICHIVINLVSLAAALFEIGREGENRWPQCQFQSLKRRLVMAEANNPVALACDHNFGQLQDGVIGGGKAAIIGKLRNFGVGKVSFNNSAKIKNLLRTGPMGANPLGV